MIELIALADGLIQRPYFFYLAYLTHWSLIVSLLYSILSLMNTIIPVKQSTTTTTIDDASVPIRVAMTWAIYSLAAVAEIVVTIMFWLVVYDGTGVSFTQISVHGIIAGLLWCDGLIVNRIPVRLRHWTEFSLPYYLLYVIWSVVQSPLVFDIDNPENNNEIDDGDEKIYASLDWVNSPTSTAILCVMIVFFLSPFVQFVLWGLSLLLGHRYVLVDDDNSNDNDNSTMSKLV